MGKFEKVKHFFPQKHFFKYLPITFQKIRKSQIPPKNFPKFPRQKTKTSQQLPQKHKKLSKTSKKTKNIQTRKPFSPKTIFPKTFPKHSKTFKKASKNKHFQPPKTIFLKTKKRFSKKLPKPLKTSTK